MVACGSCGASKELRQRMKGKIKEDKQKSQIPNKTKAQTRKAKQNKRNETNMERLEREEVTSEINTFAFSCFPINSFDSSPVVAVYLFFKSIHQFIIR